MNRKMFEVWESDGRGTRLAARFRLLNDALRHVYDHQDTKSYAIRQPDGTWYTQPGRERSIFPARKQSDRPPAPKRHSERPQPKRES